MKGGKKDAEKVNKQETTVTAGSAEREPHGGPEAVGSAEAT